MLVPGDAVSYISLFLLASFICAMMASTSSAEETYSAEVLPADRTVMIDTLTGVTLTFLTTDTPSSSIYFHERSWLANSSMIVFRGERGTMGYLTATGELVVLETPTGAVGAVTAAAKRSSIFCIRGNDVLELTPKIEISPDPTITPSKVTITERVIVTVPSGSTLNVNYDDTFLSIGIGKTVNTIRVSDGRLKEVCRLDPPLAWRGHLQWSRTESNLLSMAQGQDWRRDPDALDRIWVIDPEEGVPRPVYHQIVGELVTHESWWVDDQILFCGAPPPLGLPGDPERREMAHVNALDTTTGNVRIIGAGSWWPEGSDEEVWRRNWWHCAGSEDGRWVVADTFHGDIALFDAPNTRPLLLSSGHRPFVGSAKHPEPGWDRASRQVIFSSHMLSDEVNACVATIPDGW